jgi:hypothetical protein
MALDFPNAPTNGQSVTAPNGVIWTWDGVKWVNGTGVATYAPIGSPAFTGDPTAPTPAYGDNDTSVATTAFVQAAVAPMTHNVGRNLIHNPLFNIAQRGTGPFTANGYTLDRWTHAVITDAISAFSSVLADGDRSQIGDEAARRSYANVFTGNAAAGAANLLIQYIEDVHRLAGKTITVSFYAIASVAGMKLGVSYGQFFGTGGSPSAAVYANGTSVTLTNGWARYSVTFAVPSAVGKAIGTDGNDATEVELWYSAGSSFAGRSGGIGVQSGTVQLWGVQLEIGSVATPMEKPDPQQDLAKCQRFYQLGSASLFITATGAAQAFGYSLPLPVQMRAAPTAVISNSLPTNATSVAISWAATNFITATATATAAGGTGFNISLNLSADL